MSIAVLNTDAALTGKTLDLLESDQTISGNKTFARSPSAPFTVQAASAVVTNLDADKLDGLDSLAFVKADGTVAMTGALSLTSGQIVFPAAQASAAGVNTFDDYEEGTWTPTITGSGGGSSQVYSSQLGRYVKKGKEVTIWGDVTLSTLGTVTTAARIASLPFTAHSVMSMPISIGFFTAMTSSLVWLGGHVVGSSTTIDLYKLTAAATGVSTLVQADMSNTTRIMFSAVYEASA